MCAYDPTETYRKMSFRNIPHQVRLKKIENILRKESHKTQLDSFIDIGCASGFITQRLKDLLHITDAHGTDALEEYIKNAAVKYPDITFGIMDLNKNNHSQKKFDLVTCFETLEHVGKLDTALKNIHDSISPRGMALLSVPIEVGVIGIIKYLLKTKIYKDNFNEIGADKKKAYYKSLLKGEDISIYRRKDKDLWWDHFGFNYKLIEDYFYEKNIKFKGLTFFTTRFIIIYNSVP